MSTRFPTLSSTAARLAGAVLAIAGLGETAAARDIEIDEVTITAPGTRDGRSASIPWSGTWWPFVDLELSKGWNGTAADFTYDEAAKRWNRAATQKPVNERSPFLKYDEYVRLVTGTDPQSALLECTGDDGEDFEHTVYGDKKKQYDDEGISYSWWGHCNGWCGAAVMEKEPVSPIEARGIRFDVADLKGLLSETFWGVESDFTGKRYNKPKRYLTESREPGRQLLAALNANQPKPVADYIAWYEKAWATTMTAQARSAARSADFKDELETFESWFVRNYDEAFKDIPPATFHRILETVIGRKKLAFVADVTANEEVWNHPAFAFTTRFEQGQALTGTALQAGEKQWSVTTTVTYATDGVSESIIGVSDFTKTYTYTLVTSAAGKILRGEWTGSSIDNHPDFCWLPVNNPTGPDYGENWKVQYGKVLEILPAAHKASDARAIDLAANGVAASTRREVTKTTTWTQPVAASGEVTFSVAVASGRAVAKVKYFHEEVSGTTNVTATRTPLTALGESATAPSFSVAARLASAGKRVVVAYAYDAAGKLLGIDEITLQYTVSGGNTGGTTGGADDAYEPNDAKAAAKAVQAGSFASLQCKNDDWFKVDVTQGAGLTVALAFSHAEGDIDMTLEDAAGTQLAKSDSSANAESVARTGLAAGSYFVRVHGYNGAKAAYAMTVTVAGGSTGGGSTGGSSGAADPYEPNNDRAAAVALAAGTYANLACNDEDFYKVTLAAAGAITVKIDFRHSAGDLDLVLETSTGTQVGASEGSTDSETVTKTGLAAGTYIVRVFGYNGARAPYSMTITTTAASTGGTGGTTTRTGVVTASALNVRSGPGSSFGVVTTVPRGKVLTITGEQSSYYKVTWTGAPAGNLWVYKSYVRLN